MKIEIAESTPTGPVSLRLVHGDKTSVWDVSAYGRSRDRNNASDTERMFDEINSYWATLPIERQRALWETYDQARQILDTQYDMMVVQSKLARVVKQLFDLMPLVEVAHWRKFRSAIRIPSTIKDDYGPEDPPEMTYLRHDYELLVDLAVVLRSMVPIWGEYIGATRQETGNEFKEYNALALLYHASIVRSEPMERLRVYIEASVKKVNDPNSMATAVLNGVGSTELPDYILALTVVRRLAVGSISAPDDNSHLMSNIYHFINHKLDGMRKGRTFGAKFGGRISRKKQPDGSSDEANASVVEMYKVKQEVSDGDLVTINVYTEQTQEMALKIEPTLPLGMLTHALHSVQVLENQPIQPHQLTLTQWIMAPCLPADGIPLLEKPALLRTMAVSQAVLWHWGFYDIAALVTATPLNNHRDEISGMLESRGRIPKDLLDELQRIYPYYRQKSGKGQGTRQLNVAACAIDEFCELLCGNDWQLHAPQELIQLTSRQDNSKKLIVPGDIRVHLARLVIKIAQ